MAGIDNNTLLYLRGDSFTDLSLYNKTLSNNGCIIEDKSIKINAGNYINIDYDSNLLDVGTGDFTVSFNFKPINQMTNHFIIAHQWANNNTGYAWGMRIYNNQLMLLVNSGSESITYYSLDSIQLNSFAHYELCRKNGLVMVFINGKKIASFNYTGSLLSSTNRYISIGKIVRGTIGNLEGFLNNVFISKKCLHTEDFTPPTQPFNSININVTNKTFSQIDFNVTKLGQETINKVEVLQGNVVKETYTDNYDNLTYNIDNSLCSIGNNKITIRVTYDDNYVEEEVLTHTVTVNNLPTSSSLKDVIDRQELLNSSIEVQKNNLKNILVSKNVEVAEEENKLSSLVDKVNELGDAPPPPLYLYKDGNEYTDVTGGFVSHQTQSKPPTLTKTSSYMEYKAQSGSYTSGHYGTNLPINVTDYSLLKFEVETLNMGSTQYGCNFGLTTNKDMNSSVASIQITTNKSKHIISIDISSIRGLNYVYSDTTYNNTSRIYKIWLEK